MSAASLAEPSWRVKRFAHEDKGLRPGRGRMWRYPCGTMPAHLTIAFVRSPHAHALIRGIDTRAARTVPGVVVILTGPAINPEIGIIYTPCRPRGSAR